MPQQSEPRLLTGGINADASPERAGKDEVLNCLNARASLTDAAVKTVLGNTACTAINAMLLSGTNSLCGMCVYNTTVYLLFHNATRCYILSYDKATDTGFTLISDTYVTGGLGWGFDTYISCAATESVLIFTDNLGVRYVKTSPAYTVAITQGQLSLVTEPGVVPVVPTRVNLAAPSTIQTKAVQFGYRFINEDGFTSVLSPYSLTSIPTRQSAIFANPDAGTAITVVLPYAQKIPTNWKQVDLIAIFLNLNAPTGADYFVIKSWNVAIAADAAAVTAHNASVTNLTLTNWTGNTFDLLDTVYTSKQFDQMPLTAKALALAANRLLLGGAVEGYTTPTAVPNITVTQNTFTADDPTHTDYDPYILFVKEAGVKKWYFAIIVRIGTLNYLLPDDCSHGSFEFDAEKLPNDPGPLDMYVTVPNGLFDLPQRVSVESLTKLAETGDPDVAAIGDATETGAAEALARFNIVAEANKDINSNIIPDREASARNMYLMPWVCIAANIGVEVTPDEFGTGSESRAFLSGVAYNAGIQYYDNALRKPGVVTLPQVVIPDYDVATRTFVESISLTLPAVTTAIPIYATHFSYTLSPGGRATRFGMFFGGIVKALIRDGEGNIAYSDPLLLATLAGYTIYGIGVPIPDTFKYEYTAGDYMLYSSTTGATGRANVIGTYQGHIVLEVSLGSMYTICAGYSTKIKITYGATNAEYEATLAGSSSDQAKVAFTLISGVLATSNQFEVAAFGNIVGGQFGNFYASGTQSLDIYGDGHTQIRTSDCGGGTLLSMTPNETTGIIRWINDLGRIAPTDTVGQKDLPSIVRWSNTAIPGASFNGYASFDSGDYKHVDATAGDITVLMLTTRGIQDGGQLLVLCERNSFVGLVDKQELTTADGRDIIVSGEVLSDFNPITGGWGCQDPRSAVPHEGSVWWWDRNRREAVEFNASGAQAISRHKMASVFSQLTGAVTASVNPYTQEVLFSFPAITDNRATLPTTTLKDPDYPLYPEGYTYAYNWVENKWTLVYASGATIFSIQNDVFSFKSNSFWKEFRSGSTIYGGAITTIIAIPFNATYPATVTPGAVELDCDVQPSQAWVVGRDGSTTQVAQVNAWVRREGTWQGMVRRNRNRPGSISSEWPLIGVNGDSVKTRCPILVLVWTSPVTIRSAVISTQLSSGHLK